jgi:hypothetical protein
MCACVCGAGATGKEPTLEIFFLDGSKIVTYEFGLFSDDYSSTKLTHLRMKWRRRKIFIEDCLLCNLCLSPV